MKLQRRKKKKEKLENEREIRRERYIDGEIEIKREIHLLVAKTAEKSADPFDPILPDREVVDEKVPQKTTNSSLV